jgi:hypothetical protein
MENSREYVKKYHTGLRPSGDILGSATSTWSLEKISRHSPGYHEVRSF